MLICQTKQNQEPVGGQPKPRSPRLDSAPAGIAVSDKPIASPNARMKSFRLVLISEQTGKTSPPPQAMQDPAVARAGSIHSGDCRGMIVGCGEVLECPLRFTNQCTAQFEAVAPLLGAASGLPSQAPGRRTGHGARPQDGPED